MVRSLRSGCELTCEKEPSMRLLSMAIFTAPSVSFMAARYDRQPCFTWWIQLNNKLKKRKTKKAMI